MKHASLLIYSLMIKYREESAVKDNNIIKRNDIILYSRRRESREYNVHPRLSVCASVCHFVCLSARWNQTAKTTIIKLATGIVHHESWLPI